MNKTLKLITIVSACYLLISTDCNNNQVNNENDTTLPVISLTKGPDTLYVGDSWQEPGYEAIDNVDGSLTDAVEVSGTVDTSLEGSYTITYSIKDKADNAASEMRSVVVLASPDIWANYTFSGNPLDVSGHQHHATVIGATLTSDRFNNEESAYAFSGAGDQYVVDSTITDFPEGNCSKTIAGWIKTSVTTNQAFFGLGSPKSGASFQITVGPSGGKQVIRVNGWESTYDWGTGVLASVCCNDKWHHLAVTYDTKQTILYVDGVQKAETSNYHYNTDPQTGIVMIGNEIDYTGWPVKGSIDDVRLYSRALKPIQIQALFKINNYVGDTTPTQVPVNKNTSANY